MRVCLAAYHDLVALVMSRWDSDRAHSHLNRLLKPKYMEVVGKFAARGGISIDPFVNGGTGAKYKALARKRFEEWNGVR